MNNFDLNDRSKEGEAVELLDDHLNIDKYNQFSSNFKEADDDSDVRIEGEEETADDSLEIDQEDEDFVENMVEEYEGEVVEDNLSERSGEKINGMHFESNTIESLVKNDNKDCEEQQEANTIDVTPVQLPPGITLERLDETFEEDKSDVNVKLKSSSSSNTSL